MSNLWDKDAKRLYRKLFKEYKREGCSNEAYPEDMENGASNLLLCDDCYTEIRYLLADYLDIHIQEIKI